MTQSNMLVTLRSHVIFLAQQHHLRVIEDPNLQVEDAVAWPHPDIRTVVISPIVDDRSYCAALHEMGHCAAPGGFNPSRDYRGTTMRESRFTMEEEDAAWTWAREQTLLWTAEMEVLYQWARETYRQAVVRAFKASIKTPTRKLSDWN